MLLAFTGNSTIEKNNFVGNYHSIYLSDSVNNTISENSIFGSGRLGDTCRGIMLWYSSNNSLVANNITTHDWEGIALVKSDNNTIIGNTITECWAEGLSLDGSSNNTISGNNIANNCKGIELSQSSNNTISGNNISDNAVWDLGYGIKLSTFSSNNTIIMNNITHNDCGIRLDKSSNNKIYHNNLISNGQQANTTTPGYGNAWDNGYPSGGNYWSGFTDADQYSGTYQNETGSDGIWDHPYVVDENNIDNYPLIPEFPSFLILPLCMATATLVVILCKRKMCY